MAVTDGAKGPINDRLRILIIAGAPEATLRLGKQLRKVNLALKDELLNRQSETDQLSKTRVWLAAIRAERDKLQESLNVRDEVVAWFRSHVAQLTQQLTLPPS